MSQVANIGVGRDSTGWYCRVLECLETRVARGARVRVVRVNPEAHDWVSQMAGLDALIWNPCYMGPVSASFFKEKVYFIERHLGVRVLPSFRDLWHFENKVSQCCMFDKLDVPRPRTIVSFEYHDAMSSAPALGLPVVAKEPYGAGSSNVVLLRSERQRERYLQRAFAQQLWHERKSQSSPAFTAASSALTPWFRAKVRQRVLGQERHGHVLLQEFVPGNDRDLRVNVYGRHALGFWRLNRTGDFRASGSGRFDFDQRPVPEAAIELCYRTASALEMNIVSFDVLFKDGEPIILEVSYGTPPEPPFKATQRWIRHLDGRLERYEGHVWPQDQWVELLFEQMRIEG